MKILSIVDTFPPLFGGVGEYTFYLLKAFYAQGHEVGVICGIDDAERTMDWCEVYPIVEDWNNKTSLKKCVNRINEIKPDILLIQYDGFAYSKHGIPFSLTYLMLKSRKAKRKVVFFHETRSKFKRFGLFRFINVLVQIMSLTLIHYYSHLSITSVPLYKKLIQGPFLTSKDVEIVRIGSNVIIKENQEKNYDLEKKLGIVNNFTLGTFGHKPRSILYILDNMPILIKTYSNIKLLIIGKFKKEIFKIIEEKIKLLGIEDYIILTGYLPSERVYDYLSLIDIYLMLEPINQDGLWTGTSTRSGSLAAAFGVGLPIIGTRGEKTDSFFTADNILLIDRLEIETLKKAIYKIKNNTHFKQNLTRGAKQSYEQELSWKSIAFKMNILFEKILKNKD